MMAFEECSSTVKMKKVKRRGLFYVYIVECRDGSYYTGYTLDINRRMGLHNTGKGAKYTRGRRPVKLIWRREYKYFKKAILEEKRIKRLTRLQKETLVYGDGE
jgi:putative endonuclease